MNNDFDIDIINNENNENNESNKKVSKKKIIMISLPIVFVILMVVIVKVKYSFFNSVKNKIVASNFKCEKGYKLKSKKCILTKDQSVVLLGNVNSDDSINQTDLDVLKILTDSQGFNDLSYAASDINHDGLVNDEDLELLTDYVKNTTNNNDIGNLKVCPMDDEVSTYYYDKKSDKCVQIIVKDAAKKNEQDIVLESYDNNTSNYDTNGMQIGTTSNYNTDSMQYHTSSYSSNTSNYSNNTSTVVTRNFNHVYDPVYDTSNAPTYNPYPSTHEYYHSPYSTNSSYYGTGYNTSNYTTNYNTSYTTNSYYEPIVEEPKEAVKNSTNDSKILYSKDSLIKIEDVTVPNYDKEYIKKDKLDFQFRVHQQGTGFYYYTVKSYYGSNDYNLGYLNTITQCQKLNTSGVLDVNMKIFENNSRLVLSVYADKDCRSQKLKAQYISSKYSILHKNKIAKIEEKTYKIKAGVRIFVVKPLDTTNDFNYRIRYAISDGNNYYVKEHGECFKVVHGMNQLKDSSSNSLDIYSDNKCSKNVKKINLK